MFVHQWSSATRKNAVFSLDAKSVVQMWCKIKNKKPQSFDLQLIEVFYCSP